MKIAKKNYIFFIIKKKNYSFCVYKNNIIVKKTIEVLYINQQNC